MNLSELAIHHSATVVSVRSDGSDLSNSFRDRLEAMGLRKGRTVQVMRKAPGGDPYEVRVGSTTEIAIRKSEAALVEITDVTDLKKS
jgi:ferrous iron transport protein A|tara:strand:- start:703 stop:963 length:261 start_codon:yes stop_codon:yes gene_type:complete